MYKRQGLKTEGRVALKEFAGPGREGTLKVGDEVEVYLERVENALGEAVISRDKARREESWVKLEKAFEKQEKVDGIISVSYTHLDVYKRQVENRRQDARREPLKFPAACVLHLSARLSICY